MIQLNKAEVQVPIAAYLSTSNRTSSNSNGKILGNVRYHPSIAYKIMKRPAMKNKTEIT